MRAGGKKSRSYSSEDFVCSAGSDSNSNPTVPGPPCSGSSLVSGYPVSWSVLPLSLQFSEYIHAQVASGKGKLAPGFDAEMIVKNMFTNQDRNGDGKVTAEEFKLKDQETKHDEL